MNELLQTYADLVPAYMTVIAVVIVALEWIALTVLKRVESHKEGWVNIGSAALTYLPIFAVNMFITISLMFWMYQFRLFDLGLEWWVWVLCYIGYDFMSYAVHWLSHKVRFFWCIHSVHHSPKEIKASVAFRGSFAEFLLAPHLILWLPLLGFHPLMIVIVEGVGQLYGVPLHLSEKIFPRTKWKWPKWLFITPSIHRLHHARNGVYLDTNYGLTFNIWDRIFNTYQPQVEKLQSEYGLMKDIRSDHLLEAQTDEFATLWRDMKTAPNFMDKMRYLFYPPGWRHDGTGATAKQIRKEALSDLEKEE